ncbi:protease inhibitor I42 family protein [Streptomyces sp. NPDC088789]|uniref:protease inhibitor I42 family protein n=1 Tax=Streptomyces sp. NPDC088789 TaxID=3365899 RepID=UPI003816C9CC
MTTPTRTRSTSRSRAARTGRGLAALAGAALLTLGAAACGSEDGSPRSHPTSDTEVGAAVGEEFTLVVDENPSTGERWYLATPKPDSAVVRDTGEDFEADEDAEEMTGAGGQRVFTFEATGAGSTEIVLLHCPVGTCTSGTQSPGTPSPGTQPSEPPASVPDPRRITYTVTVS